MNSNHEFVRRRKLSSPILGVDSEKGHYTRRCPVKTKPGNKPVRATIENQGEISRSVLLSSSSQYVVSLCSTYAVNFHTLFLSPGDYLQIVKVNKPLCSELGQINLCSITFPTAKSQPGLSFIIDQAICPKTFSTTW